MKKAIKLLLILVFATAILLLAACSSDDADGSSSQGQPSGKITLNVYNWGEYISDGSEDSLDVNKAFEEWCKTEKGLDVEVNYMTFDSNESMYNKLKSGAVSYDIVVPSDYMIARMVSEGMLEELDYGNIPNFDKNIDKRFVSPYYDVEQKYSVPYFVGYVGIMYNTKYVSEDDIGGWDLLWNENYRGKILQFNNSRDAFGTAMFKNGDSVNSTDEAVWRSALDELKKQKPILQAYVMDEIFNKMKNESAWIAPYYAGDFLSMYTENDSLAFYFPEGGTNVFNDAMCIPKGAKNKTVAEYYINFMLEPEIGKANSEFVYYATPNTLVNSDPEYIEYMTEEAHENAMYYLNPNFGEGYVTEYYHNFDDETLVLVNSLWEELKIDSISDKGVYVTCVVIVISISAYLIFKFIRQRRRRRYY